jgi:hypothetical protein
MEGRIMCNEVKSRIIIVAAVLLPHGRHSVLSKNEDAVNEWTPSGIIPGTGADFFG